MKFNWFGNWSWWDCDVCEVFVGSVWCNFWWLCGCFRILFYWNRKYCFCCLLLIDIFEMREDVNLDIWGMILWYMGIYIWIRMDLINGRLLVFWCELNELSFRIECGVLYMRVFFCLLNFVILFVEVFVCGLIVSVGWIFI